MRLARIRMMMRTMMVGMIGLAFVGCSQGAAQKDSPGRLSGVERQQMEARASSAEGAPISVLYSNGKIATHRVNLQGLNRLENLVLESDPEAVLFLDEKAVGIAEHVAGAAGVPDVRDSGASLTPDENLLFRGKESFELSAWEKSFPEADGRGVKIAVVDDGVALNREGLKVTSTGLPKFAKSINVGPSWNVAVRRTADSCTRRPVLTEELSKAWTIDSKAIPEAKDWLASQAFDIHPCGVNADLPLQEENCPAWEKVFPNGKTRLIDGKFAGAARWIEFTDSATGEARQRVLFDVDGDGKIADDEVFTAISDPAAASTGAGTIRALSRGDAIGFDIFAVSSVAGGHPLFPAQSRDFPISDCAAKSAVDYVITLALPNNTDSAFGTHGDGVAGITAGHKIGKRGFDGVAPGAQIVDVHFADEVSNRRYSISEVGRALLIGGKHADIVNLSYSLFFDSAASQVAMGRFLTGLLNQTDAIFFFSAGNNGPGRGSMNRALLYPADGIAVGAYLDPLLAQTTFGSSTPYGGVVSYSSRGPGADGASGPLLLSPLAGITVYPGEFGGYAPFSGTSSATPALSGFTARLISQIRAEGMPVKRAWLRQALIYSAQPLTDFQFIDQGYGIPKLTAALTKYREFAAAGRTLPRLDVEGPVNSRGVANRGVYVRGSLDRADTYKFTLAARFSSEWSAQDKGNYAEALTLEADQPWISVTAHTLVAVRGATPEVAIDWKTLDAKGPGEYLGLIRVKNFDTGELRAVIPVTILKPHLFDLASGAPLTLTAPLESGEVQRVFVETPAGADYLVFKRQSQTASQPLCGGLRAYNANGMNIAPQVYRKTSRTEQSSWAVGTGGFFEIVWVGGNSHTSCPRAQSLTTQLQWVGVRAEMQEVKVSATDATDWTASYRVTSTLPSQAGEISIGALGTLRTLKATRAAGQSDYLFPAGTVTAAGVKTEIRLPKSYFEARASSFSYPYVWVEHLSAKAGAATGGIRAKLGLADTGAWTAIDGERLLEGLSVFDEGTTTGLLSREIEVEIYETLATPFAGKASVLDRAYVDVGASRPQGISSSFKFATGDKAVFNSWNDGVLKCEFRPSGFEMDLPCGTLKTQIW